VKTGKHELVVGASSGVGRTTAHKVAPPDLIPSIKQRNPNVDVTHEPLDVSSLWDVRRFTDKHKDVEFDWIVMSPGMMTLNGRTETPEGLDVKMATHYYSESGLLSRLRRSF
jgi:NAD(P)-dependent dehydrogenase (short-subunit alcohol dehydrogenase family)